MNQFKKWQCQFIAKEMTEILKQKSYDAHYAENLDEAKQINGTKGDSIRSQRRGRRLGNACGNGFN
jgi:hypothetical protein